jgi:hypothetical protein
LTKKYFSQNASLSIWYASSDEPGPDISSFIAIAALFIVYTGFVGHNKI